MAVDFTRLMNTKRTLGYCTSHADIKPTARTLKSRHSLAGLNQSKRTERDMRRRLVLVLSQAMANLLPALLYCVGSMLVGSQNLYRQSTYLCYYLP